MTDYNPAHYAAEGYRGNDGATIYCTQCPSTHSIVYTVDCDAEDDTQTLDLIINATRQHHDDHHEGK